MADLHEVRTVVYKHGENSFELALKQGFAVSFYGCREGEMVLILPNITEEEMSSLVKQRGWEEVVY